MTSPDVEHARDRTIEAVVQAWRATSQASVWFNDRELAVALTDLEATMPRAEAS